MKESMTSKKIKDKARRAFRIARKNQERHLNALYRG